MYAISNLTIFTRNVNIQWASIIASYLKDFFSYAGGNQGQEEVVLRQNYTLQFQKVLESL